MSTLISKKFAIYDVNNMPSVEIFENGKKYRDRKLIVSPYTTGESVLVLQTTFLANYKTELLNKEELEARAHSHESAEEIMIFNREAQVIVDGEIYHVPAGGTLIAKPGCRHGCQFVDNTKDGTITCIFVPSIPADEDPDYIELIQKTKEYFAGADIVRLV